MMSGALRRGRQGATADAIRALDPVVIRRVAALCDGHSILEPRTLALAGLPAEVVEQLTVTHPSDGTLKGTLFVEGQPVPELRGVCGLDALRLLADALGLEYRSCFGRRSQARAIRQALEDHFGPAARTDTPDPTPPDPTLPDPTPPETP